MEIASGSGEELGSTNDLIEKEGGLFELFESWFEAWDSIG